MPHYSFPGQTKVPAYCCKKKPCEPFTIIEVCPPKPYVKDNACKPNYYDRAIIRCPRISKRCKAKFLLETFRGLYLQPTNLDKFCGFDLFKDGDVVAVQAQLECVDPCQENVNDSTTNYNPCTTDGCTTQKQCDPCNPCNPCKPCDPCKCNPCSIPLSHSSQSFSNSFCDYLECCETIPAKIFDIKRVWKLDIKTVSGRVSTAIDSNGIMFHKLTEVYHPGAGNPYFRMTENSLLFNPYVIDYDIYNIMGVCDLNETLAFLEGKNITASYTDYGTETKERCGIPIVITKFNVI